MRRLDNLPQEHLAAYVRQLQQDLDELKSGEQWVSGASVLFHQSDSGNAYDWTGTLTPYEAAAGGSERLLVTATGPEDEVLYADLIQQIATGTPDNVRTYAQALASSAGGGFLNYFLDVSQDFPPSLSEDASNGFTTPWPAGSSSTNQRQWLVWLEGDDTTTFFYKCWIVASADVTISVEAI